MSSARTLAAPLFALLVLGAHRANAAVTAISVNAAAVARVASDNTTTYSCPARTSGACVVDGSYQGIGSVDCSADTVISLPVTLSTDDNGVSDMGTLQVWAGLGDCTHGTTACWMVASSLTNPPLDTSTTVHVRVADVVMFLGQASPPQSYTASPAATACMNSYQTTGSVADEAGLGTTQVIGTPVNLFLIWTPTSGTVVDSAAYPVKVKLVGPAAPTGVTAQTADSSLTVSWAPESDSTIQGFNIYAATASGGADAACTGSLNTSSLMCSTGDAGTGGSCQEVPGPTSGSLTGLTNGVEYAIAVAAFDEYGNLGAASTPTCASPEPITDFWKAYNSDGGNAFCAVEVVGRSGGGVAGILLGLWALVWVRRRRA